MPLILPSYIVHFLTFKYINAFSSVIFIVFKMLHYAYNSRLTFINEQAHLQQHLQSIVILTFSYKQGSLP